MDDSSHALLKRIALGEDSSLELKQVRFAGEKLVGPGRDSLADEIGAFANGRGGTIVLGVDDSSREVLGIPNNQLDRVESLIREVCNDAIKPPIAPHVTRLTLPTAAPMHVTKPTSSMPPTSRGRWTCRSSTLAGLWRATCALPQPST